LVQVNHELDSNRRERFENKAHGAQKPERTEVREDFEHRATQLSGRATDL